VVASINPADEAGAALAEIVLSPDLEGGPPRYFPSHSRWKESPSSEASYDRVRARELWELSAELVRLGPADSPLA
jgi:hypothetical protein